LQVKDVLEGNDQSRRSGNEYVRATVGKIAHDVYLDDGPVVKAVLRSS
jgi:hypothetical protein